VTPTSNVNGGGNGTTFLGGFGFTAAAPLPGLEISGNISTSYRIASTQTYATFFDVFSNFRTYELLPKANEIDPDARGSDYASGSIGVGLRHRQVFSEGGLPTDFSLRFAQNWSEGVVATRTLDLSFAHQWALSEETTLGFSLSSQNLIAKDDPSADSYGLTTTWTQKIGEDRLSLSLAGRRSYSDDPSRGYVSKRVFGSYDFGNDLYGLNFGVTFDFDARDFDQGPPGTGLDRRDETRSLTLRIRNENIEFYGFQPILTLNKTDVSSTVGQYNREFLSLGFDIQSSF